MTELVKRQMLNVFYMNQNLDFQKWIWVLVALLVGLGGGYYYGNVQGVAKEKAAEESRKKDAEKEAAKAVNPFEQTTANPFEKSPTNPFENVKVNPFK